MQLSDFDYNLPPYLIAREPARPRDASRMMIVDRASDSLIDSRFADLPEFLVPGDLLVINDTRVMKARIYGELTRVDGSARRIELFFANPVTDKRWEVLCRPAKRVRVGDRVALGGGATGIFRESRDGGLRLLDVISEIPVAELLEHEGHVPLPPYIGRPDTESDAVEYQTMFAADAGAVAAPTAGLHFTPGVVDALRQKGVGIAHITLHVGIGTFLPVRTDDPRQHRLKPEMFRITEEAARQIRSAKAANRRVIAVGTTCTRTLEYVVAKHNCIRADSGYADLYILPGHRFWTVDGLLTNFHLPRSTLLMLVSAFASRERILRAYAHAISERYRFYSYGDCMLII